MKHWFRAPTLGLLFVFAIQVSILTSCAEDETVLKTPPNPEILFLSSAERGDFTEIKQWLDRGVSVHAKDSLGNSALWKATDIESKEIVEYLLQRGANPNQRNTAGETPLYRAVFRGNLDLVKTFILAGAEIHTKTVSGESLFDLADERGEDAILKFLQERSKRFP